MTMCFQLRTMLKMLKVKDQTFGIITKLMVLRANGEGQKIYYDKMHLL